MTRAQYLKALRDLGLTRASDRTAALLGVSKRHAQRIAAGDSRVPQVVALLLEQYLRSGLPTVPAEPGSRPRH